MCGGVAGAFSKTCTAPLARITILRQLQSTGAVAGWAGTAKVGIVPALAKIIREEGVRALWKGNMVTVIQRLPYSSINFYLYENIMDFLEGEGAFGRGRNEGRGLGWDVARRLVAGGSAGMIACACTYPLDLVRTRLAAQTTVRHYDGLLHALFVIGSKEGPRGLYRGLAPTLAQIGPNLAINFAAYETLSKLAKEHELGERVPPAIVSLACGSTSAVVSATATYPLDLVRRRLQMRCAQDRGHGFVRVFRDIFAAEGFGGFYRGIIPEYAKVVPGVSITYMTYELL
ncbi:mitochondrial carrier family, partial [Micromonas commoda]